MSHPVQFQIVPAPRMQRIHVVVRLVLLAALGSLGGSSLYGLLYLSLPALAAVLILQKGGARYLTEDGPAIGKLLGWVAWVYAYAWLLTDSVPGTSTSNPVGLEITAQGTPSAASALTRLLYALPALVVLVLLSVVACFVWVVGAVGILATERVPGVVREFLASVLRYQFRLIAYHLSLIEAYPAFGDGARAEA